MTSPSPEVAGAHLPDYYRLNVQRLRKSFAVSLGADVRADEPRRSLLSGFFTAMVVFLAQLQELASEEGLNQISAQTIDKLRQACASDPGKYARALADLDAIQRSHIVSARAKEEWAAIADETVSDIVEAEARAGLVMLNRVIMGQLSEESRRRLTWLSFRAAE